MRGLILYTKGRSRVIHVYIVYPLNFLILGFFENAFEKAKFRSHFLILGKLGQLLKQIDLEAFPVGYKYEYWNISQSTHWYTTVSYKKSSLDV